MGMLQRDLPDGLATNLVNHIRPVYGKKHSRGDNPMHLSIEQLLQADTGNIEGIAAWLTGYSCASVHAFLSKNQIIAFVARLDGITIGLLYGYVLERMDGKTPQFFVYSVDIHPGYQDKGYGSLLVQYTVDWARNTGCCESFGFTDKDNPRACRVYEKAGMTHSTGDCDRMYVVSI